MVLCDMVRRCFAALHFLHLSTYPRIVHIVVEFDISKRFNVKIDLDSMLCVVYTSSRSSRTIFFFYAVNKTKEYLPHKSALLSRNERNFQVFITRVEFRVRRDGADEDQVERVGKNKKRIYGSTNVNYSSGFSI